MSLLIAADGMVALAVGLAIALAAFGGAFGMAFSIAKAMDALAKQPEIDSKIRSMLIVGLVFIETAIIYALVIGILILVM
ncbi:MAG: ATP synthase F0 subunit C [Clostridia bacterium]|nr:ATP synthase F0 subunit C [Clostridia bacterium]